MDRRRSEREALLELLDDLPLHRYGSGLTPAPFAWISRTVANVSASLARLSGR